MAPLGVFISYCHKDIRWLKRLRVHLKPLESWGLIRCWDDSEIRQGERWKPMIRERIAGASVAILLISADYLASVFIASEELPRILASEQSRGLVVLPVILSPCRFDRTPVLSQIQAVNPSERPVIAMGVPEREMHFTNLANILEELAGLDTPTSNP